jgi:hypothetical protein
MLLRAVAESGQESWATGSRHGRHFKAAIIGVAKKSGADFPSLNPLLPDILSPRHESEPITSLRGHHTTLSFNNYGRPVPAESRSHAHGSFVGEDSDDRSAGASHHINAWGCGSGAVTGACREACILCTFVELRHATNTFVCLLTHLFG